MRNAKPCGCSFSQSDSCMAGERIRVNSASSCGCDRNHYRCQESRCPRPCTPPTCPSRPCPPKPCRPQRPCPRPDCEDRCVDQYRNCLRNCRCERQNQCDCRNRVILSIIAMMTAAMTSRSVVSALNFPV